MPGYFMFVRAMLMIWGFTILLSVGINMLLGGISNMIVHCVTTQGRERRTGLLVFFACLAAVGCLVVLCAHLSLTAALW
jgi:hypothetical protein